MSFSYLRDPLFLSCFVCYWINRFVIEPQTNIAFFHSYLNDLICIPFLVPILLFIMRCCRIRSHDMPPHPFEVFIPLVVWSIMYEIIFPQHPYWSQWTTGDPYDILCYAIGASIALIFWNRFYQPKAMQTAS
jgi:hypothetical protein